VSPSSKFAIVEPPRCGSKREEKQELSALVRYGGSGVQRREDRTLDQAISRISTRTDIAIAEVYGKLEVQAVKVDGVLATIGRAAQGAARLGQLENQLVEMVPGSAAKVGYIIDRGILALGDIVDDTVTQLRWSR